jgi:hypothetical protein
MSEMGADIRGGEITVQERQREVIWGMKELRWSQ